MKKNVRQKQHPAHNMVGKMLISMRRLNIYILVITPIIIALLLLGLLLAVGNKLYGAAMPEAYQAVSGVVFLVIVSFSGVVQIYRGEGPGPLGYPVFGAWPVISGWIITIVCWASIIYLIARIFKLMP